MTGDVVVSGPLGVLELRARLAGWEFETLAGWRPMAQFDPYGMAPPDGAVPAGANWGPQWTPYAGEIVQAADGAVSVRDVPAFPAIRPFLLGRFPVRLERVASAEPCVLCGGASGRPAGADGTACAVCVAEADEYARELAL
jgi:hypothetical protein